MATQSHPDHLKGFIRRTEVQRLCGLERSNLYRRMDCGTFPQAIKLGDRAVGWRRSDIDAWLANPAGWRQAAPVVSPTDAPVPAQATPVSEQD